MPSNTKKVWSSPERAQKASETRAASGSEEQAKSKLSEMADRLFGSGDSDLARAHNEVIAARLSASQMGLPQESLAQLRGAGEQEDLGSNILRSIGRGKGGPVNLEQAGMARGVQASQLGQADIGERLTALGQSDAIRRSAMEAVSKGQGADLNSRQFEGGLASQQLGRGLGELDAQRQAAFAEQAMIAQKLMAETGMKWDEAIAKAKYDFEMAERAKEKQKNRNKAWWSAGGAAVGAGIGIGATALTGGAAAPLIPVLSTLGAAGGGVAGEKWG
jgi:hypothetical protein